MIRYLALVLALGLATVPSQVRLSAAASAKPVSIPNSQVIDFTSSVNQRPYRLLVALPDGPPPPEGFAVMYIIDGNLHFAAAYDTLRLQSRHQVKKAVLVGIGYQTDDQGQQLDLRMNDLTLPTSQADADAMIANGFPKEALDLRPSGMSAFLDTIERDVKPLIAGLTKIDAGNQTLWGHSLGGLTVLHALFTRPTAYQTFAAVSPSIYWANDKVLADEAAFKAKVEAGAVAPRLLLMVGGEEAGPIKVWPGAPIPQDSMDKMLRFTRMVDGARSLGERLQKIRGPAGYSVVTLVFDAEDHVSVPPVALSRTMRFALNKGGGGSWAVSNGPRAP